MDLSEWEEKDDNNEHFSKTSLREINIQWQKKKKKNTVKDPALE